MPDNTQTPPWGDDFDAERAWTLVQNLRGEVATEKAKTTTERQAREAAEAKAAEQDPEGKIAAAVKRAEDAEQKLAVSSVLVDYPALKGFEDLLTGKTPEEITAQAKRLAALQTPGTPAGDESKTDDEGKGKADDEGKTPETPQSQTPTPALTPGHGGADSTPFDPAAIAKSARR